MQYFPPPEKQASAEAFSLTLLKVVRATAKVVADSAQQRGERNKSGTSNRTNAMVATLVEVVSLVIAWDNDPRLLGECRDALTTLINDKRDPNMRYLGLNLLGRMSFCQSAQQNIFVEQVAKNQATIVAALHDADPSVKQRALDLLYQIADSENAAGVVGELLEYLPIADTVLREDLVLMVAILAEKFCGEVAWYVDVIVRLIEGSNSIPKDIWHRLIHIVINTEEVQKYAIEKIFQALHSCKVENEVLLLCAAFLLGEFGYQIALESGCTPIEQLTALHGRYSQASTATKALLLSTYVKFYNLYDNAAVRGKIIKILLNARSSFDAELQQRAGEYYTLITFASDETLQACLEPLPPFDVDVNTIVDKLRNKKRGEDRNLWDERGKARDQLQLQQSEVLNRAKVSALITDVQPTTQRPEQVYEQHSDPVPAVAASAPNENQAHLKTQGADMLGSPAAVGGTPNLDELFTGGGSGSTGPSTAVMVHDNTNGIWDKLVKAAKIAATSPCPSELYSSPDGLFKITEAHESRQADCRAQLSITNMDPSRPLHFSVRLGEDIPSSLIVQMKPPLSSTVQPNASESVMFAARCISAFDGLPATVTVEVAYAQSPKQRIAFPLPFSILSFIEPYKQQGVNAERISAMWDNTISGTRSYNNKNNANLACIAHTIPLSAALLNKHNNNAVSAVEAIFFSRLRLHPLRCASSPARIIAAGALAMMPGDQVQFEAVLCAITLTGNGSGSTDENVVFGFDAASIGPQTTTVETRSPQQMIEFELLQYATEIFRGNL